MTPWVKRLIVANAAVFFLQMTASPAYFSRFAFVPIYVLERPWTVVTYMFLHANITHILFNMLALFFFGPRVEERLGSGHFIALYLISGVAGGSPTAATGRR